MKSICNATYSLFISEHIEKEYYRVTGKSLKDSLIDEGHLIATIEAAKRNSMFLKRESISLSSISQVVDVDPQSKWNTKSSYFEAIGVPAFISRFKTSIGIRAVKDGNVQSLSRNDDDILSSDRIELLAALRKSSAASVATYAFGRTDWKSTITSQFTLKKDQKVKRASVSGPVEHCVLQYITRIHGSSQCKRFIRGSGCQKDITSNKITRVWTVCLPFTYEIPFFLKSLNETIWSLSMCRSFTADFHTSSLAAANAEELSILRTEISESADNLVGDIVKYWLMGSLNFDQTCTEKIVNVCRILYYFREGPCIGGQIMDLQESYLIRSYFLSCPSTHALRIMFPSLLFLPPGLKDKSDTLLPVQTCPGAMLCFPKSAFILDAGDSVYVWLGSNIDSVFNKSDIARLLDMAQAIASDRYPAAVSKVVQSIGDSSKLTFDERFIYARLSPTQQDLREVQLYTIANICTEIELMKSTDPKQIKDNAISTFLDSVTTEILDSIQERAPTTDQQSFMLYVSSRAPRLFEYLRNQGKLSIIRFQHLVKLCPTVVDIGLANLTAPRPMQPIDRNFSSSYNLAGARNVDLSASIINTTLLQEKI